MTIFVYSFLDDDSETPESAVGVELSEEGGADAALDWDQDHAELSIFGQAGHETEGRAFAFFGALSVGAESVRPGDLRIADSLEWQIEAGGLFD